MQFGAISQRVFLIAALSCGLIASSAAAQSFPVSDEDGLMDYGAWQTLEEGIGGSVRTDAEGGWTELKVERISSVGISIDSLDFTISYGVYDDFLSGFSRLMDRNLSNRVQLVVDSTVFTTASSSYSRGDDGSLIISMAFTPMSEDDGVLDRSEPNCQVVSALRNSHQISVRFPDNAGEAVEGFVLTGKGSSAALRNVC